MILEVRGLKVYFPVYGGKIFQKRTGSIKAVDGVDLQIKKGETLALVGESGCGKTTLAKAILGILPATSGEINFGGQDLIIISGSSRKKMSKKIQYVPQDPFLSLNPRMRVCDIVAEGIDIHKLAKNKKEKEEMTIDLMRQVELDPAARYRYSVEFSAGQRQRIAIARALALEPKLLICDEPVSSLDVSVQDQVLKLLAALREKFSLSILFITHDLAVAKIISDKAAVMYLGKIVEYAGNKDLFQNPLHPYTKILFSSAPYPDPAKVRGEKKERIYGEVPSSENVPPGCRFHTRCPIAVKDCSEAEPELRDMGKGHMTACHRI